MKVRDVLAPLPGKIISLAVTVDTVLDEDDEVLVIEALKMETVVYAPCVGKVKAVKVKLGDQVEEDNVLVSIESQ